MAWLTVAPGVSLLMLASLAHAQGSSCEQLKARLAARIETSLRGFSLEDVAASEPVPPGAKVIGTCEGGARKVLLHRSGATSSPSATAKPIPVASPAPAAAALRTTTPIASVGSATPASAPAAAVETIAPSPPAAPASATMPVQDVIATPPTPAEAPRTDGRALAQRATELLQRYGLAIAAMALSLLGAASWAWARRHRSYDAKGLPRGPKIRMK